MNSSKRITARILSVVLAIMMLFSLVTVGFTASAANVDIAETGVTMTGGEVLYLKPNSNWTQASARFAIYVYGSSGSAWASMTECTYDDGVYKVEVPSGTWTNVIFCRMNPSSSTNSWDYKWNQSGDLTYDGTKNCCSINSGQWDCGTNVTWSTFTETVPEVLPEEGDASSYYLMGTLSDWSTGANMIYTADTDVVSITFEDIEAGDYSLKVKKGDSWYGYTALCATISSADGGTITNDSDDNIVLSAAGGTYTFNYTISAGTLAIEYTAPEVEETTAAPEAEATSDETEATSDETETIVGGTELAIDWVTESGLYAYASVTEEVGTNAWQRWTNLNSVRRFYLPETASDSEVIIYNSYSEDVTINGVTISSGCYATVAYEAGVKYTCSGATTQSLIIEKTDAEGTLFINNMEGAVAVYDDDAETEEAAEGTYDLYAFLTGGTKNREAKSLGGAVASSNGLSEDTTVKKIKGRGNSTWGLDKKPFNITYSSNVTVDGMKGKKWSLLANAQDPSLIRNRLSYDLANEVNMNYACDSRFVDWFVNGFYKGSYQLTQKIEMGSNTVMPDLEEVEVDETSEDYKASDFDFILEMDTASNAASSGDLTCKTTLGQVMTFKTPDEPSDEQAAWILEKYQAVEDAIYGGDYETLATLVDIDDFARAYLVNEVTKNMDAGVTSTYFTYSSAAGKFYVSPVWDYDNAIGNSVNTSARFDEDGNTLDLTTPANWYTRDLRHYDDTYQSVFSQACKMDEFWAKVEEIWAADFADIDEILEGSNESENGRLQTADSYLDSLAVSGEWNYTIWTMTYNNGWVAAHDSLTMYEYDAEANTLTYSTKTYANSTLEGQAQYAADWLISRINWLDAQFNAATETVPDGYITIYFENNWNWPDACIYYWTAEGNNTWPGETLSVVATTTDAGYTVYECVIPEDVAGIVFNGTGEYGSEQSADITTGIADGNVYYMTYDSSTDTKPCGVYNYDEAFGTEEETTVAEETTAPEETTSDEVEDTTADEVEDTTAATVGTKTVYFTNNYGYSEPIYAYYWYEGANGDPAWPGAEMTWVENNDYGQDVYCIEVPADIDYIIFNGTGGQTADIPAAEVADGYGVYVTDEDPYYAVYQYEFDVVEETTTTVEETTTADEAKVTSANPETFDPTTDIYYEVDFVATTTDVYSNRWAYTWTPEVSGTLTLTADSSCADFWIIIENADSWFDCAELSDGNAIYTVDFAVTAGTTYYIYVATWSEADGLVSFWAEFTEGSASTITGSGTSVDPYVLNYGENALPDLAYGTETYFQYNGTYADVLDVSISGYNPRMDYFTFTILTTNGSSTDEVAMDYMGTTTASGVTPTYMASGVLLFTITNNSMMGGTGFTCTIANTSGETDTTGTEADPDTLVLDTLLMPTVNGAYYYTYTAEKDGVLSFDMYDNLNADGWVIAVIGKDVYVKSESGTSPVTVDVTEGEEITLWVANASFGEGTVYFMATLSDPVVPHAYLINSANWDEVYAYAWTDGGEITWPGVAMTKTEETVNGFDVYYIEFETAYENIIFNNNNNGSQTGDLTFEIGKYYDVKSLAWYDSLEDVPAVDTLATDRYLVGSFNGWNTTANEFKLNAEGDVIGYVTLTLEANTTYEFKVVREGTWTGNEGTITSSITGWTFSSSVGGNCTLVTGEAGEYVFSFGLETSQLSVTYPGSEDATPDEVATPEEFYIHGDFTGEWTDTTLTGDEGATVLTATMRIEAGTYEFKLFDDLDNWYGNDGVISDVCTGWTMRTTAGNATLEATGGVYTFSLDTTTMKLTITAELDEVATPDEPVVEYFTVIYLNADGSYLGFEKVEAGAAAVGIDAPTMAADAQYTYTFTGWDADLTAIDADVVVTAQYSTTVNEYTVIFVDYDGTVLDTQTVAYGSSATAPADPSRTGYTFKGWDVAYDNITGDTTVTAQYSKIATAVTTGKLTVEVIGGAGFTISVDGGAARPQGSSYMNTKMAIGASVTVVASTTAGNEFLGWVDSNTGAVLSTSETYTFTATGNDMIKALYRTSVDGVNLVIFKNDKAAAGNGQIIDMQYYASTDSISFPEEPSQPGYDFAGWDMTEAEIQAAIANGEDVTVLATWTVRKVYFTVTVNNGSVTTNGGTNDAGQYLAYKGTTVVADAAADGMKFAYWVDGNGNVMSYKAEYKFYPTEDIELTAVYVAEDETVSEQVLVAIAADNSTSGDRITWIISWYVPEEVGTFVAGGIILVETKNYNESTFVVGGNASDSNVTQSAPGAVQYADQAGYGVTKGKSYVGTTWYGCTWVQYTDAVTGELVTVYSDILEATKY